MCRRERVGAVGIRSHYDYGYCPSTVQALKLNYQSKSRTTGKKGHCPATAHGKYIPIKVQAITDFSTRSSLRVAWTSNIGRLTAGSRMKRATRKLTAGQTH